MNRKSKWLVLCLAVLLNGCILAHLRTAFGELGVFPADRKSLLNDDIRHFHQALADGRLSKAFEWVDEDSYDTIKPKLLRMVGKENIVEYKLELAEYSPNAFMAEVDMKLKYFEIERMIVVERSGRETWTFRTPGGWKLTSTSVVSK